MQVKARVVAEERERARGKRGRPPTGRVTLAMIERLEGQGRTSEALLLRQFMETERRTTPRATVPTLTAEEREDRDRLFAWHARRKAKERAEDARREAQAVALRDAATLLAGLLARAFASMAPEEISALGKLAGPVPVVPIPAPPEQSGRPIWAAG